MYLVGADGTAIRLLDADAEIDDLSAKYIQFHRQRGNDLMMGLRLEQLLCSAGLERVAFEGRSSIISAPPVVRHPSWGGSYNLQLSPAGWPVRDAPGG